MSHRLYPPLLRRSHRQSIRLRDHVGPRHRRGSLKRPAARDESARSERTTEIDGRNGRIAVAPPWLLFAIQRRRLSPEMSGRRLESAQQPTLAVAALSKQVGVRLEHDAAEPPPQRTSWQGEYLVELTSQGSRRT